MALKYKDLLLVESLFRNMKCVLDSRPLYHKCDDTIRGHVFCSFLALVLMNELQTRLVDRGWTVEWNRLIDDLQELQELTLQVHDKSFVVRTPPSAGQRGQGTPGRWRCPPGRQSAEEIINSHLRRNSTKL